ncbi:MAG TPA: hypothetical protein DCQ31_19015, partial [Bacteroidales bacterium]|nr:hypothetical protein [Bacteroidales bacterium]
MQEISIFDSKFSINATQSYDLSVQFGLSGYAYAIFDTAALKYVALKYQPISWTTANAYQKTLEEFLKKDAFIGKKYNRIFFTFEGRKATLVPNKFFDENDLKSYIEFNFSNTETAEVHSQAIQVTESKLIFAVPSEITNSIAQVISTPLEFNHFAKCFITSNLKLPYAYAVSISLHDNYFYLTVAQAGKLLIFNSYTFRDDNDLV